MFYGHFPQNNAVEQIFLIPWDTPLYLYYSTLKSSKCFYFQPQNSPVKVEMSAVSLKATLAEHFDFDHMGMSTIPRPHILPRYVDK